MPPGALLRNLGNFGNHRLLTANSQYTKKIVAELGKTGKLVKQRVHPMSVLKALYVYSQGHGVRGKNTWTPEPEVVDALDAAFYNVFPVVEPTNKNIFLALDCSGSMASCFIDNMPGMSAKIAAAAMAAITVATEPNVTIMGFSSNMMDIPLTKGMKISDIMTEMGKIPFAFTDCSLPMVYARKHRLDIDGFIIYTDSETNRGGPPSESLRDYRSAMNDGAKLVVAATISSNKSIADPLDPRMLDIVGFDSGAPALINNFLRD
jgi:60 kDa SS-A/Ro ribonucleoprotein